MVLLLMQLLQLLMSCGRSRVRREVLVVMHGRAEVRVEVGG